jgi:acetylornithine deacetylase
MSRAPKVKEMVSQLISTPSISSTQTDCDQSNADVVNLIASWLDDLGFTVNTYPIDNHPGKLNLIARLGQGTDGLLLAGHSDTVPFDSHLWSSDPFTLKESDDRWYGLGSCDMKSFFALAIEATKPFLDATLDHPLVIMATADEESSMSGARSLMAEELGGSRFAVIGEPTDLTPITRHKGIMMLNLRVTGTSGHSSNPELGDNAIEGMQSVLSELNQYKNELKELHCDDSFNVTYPTLNFGCIHGGDNPNRICDHVDLSFDFRNLPSMDMSGFLEELENRLNGRIESEGLACSLDYLHAPVPAFENSNSTLAPVIESLVDQKSASVAFATEAPFLQALDVDTVVIGPGSINQAHQPNEYLPLKQINPAIDMLGNLITRYCVT